jgi:multiple sugar transport system substrate-binding protein
VWKRIDDQERDAFLNGRKSASQAAHDAAVLINQEIERSLTEDPSLRTSYDQLVAIQTQIDQRRAGGEKVPLGWIRNPLHRAYYRFKGWTE